MIPTLDNNNFNTNPQNKLAEFLSHKSYRYRLGTYWVRKISTMGTRQMFDTQMKQIHQITPLFKQSGQATPLLVTRALHTRSVFARTH